MGELLELVVPQIQAHWEKVAFIVLCYDIPVVEPIQKKHQNDVNMCCLEMFKIWLKGAQGVKPITWSTLIERLKKVEELIGATEVIERRLRDL